MTFPPNGQVVFSQTLRRRGLWLSAIAAVALTAGSVVACSVPVFRYALEHWAADPYRVVVFHRDPMTEDQQAQLRVLEGSNPSSRGRPNAAVHTVDLNADTTPELLRLWEAQETETLPWMVVLYPWANRIPGTAWSGAFDAGTVDALVDSPARRTVARLLLEGESVVWVFLELGEVERDEAVFRRLEERLAELEETLELPVLSEQDVRDGLAPVETVAMKLSFSVVRLSRRDPAEQAFVRMLLGTEADLVDLQEPIAFPIFGRGRSLFALAGKGINNAMIAEASAFLVGPCSCQVKEQNPGVDLLMAVAWDEMVTVTPGIQRDLPPLTGLTDMDASSEAHGSRLSQPRDSANPGNSAVQGADAPAGPVGETSQRPPDANLEGIGTSATQSETARASPVLRNALVALLVGGLGVLGIGLYLARK